MKNKLLAIAWGALFVLCASMSFFGDTQGAQYAALFALGIIFFIPGGILLYRGIKTENVAVCRSIFWVSLCSLVFTLTMLIVTLATVHQSEAVQMAMSIILAVVSVPMFCLQGWWAISWFVWACLMIASASCLRKLKKK